MLTSANTSPLHLVAFISEFASRWLRLASDPDPIQVPSSRHVMMENPLPSSILPKSGGLRKSSSTRSLASLADVQALIIAQDEEEQAQQRRKSLSKPPRHASVPMYAQILLQLWQSELQRNDVDLTSDFFYDLNGTEEQGVQLVGRMQALGFNITVPQFLAMHRCSIYSVLLVAL
ncbi:hypothetical protein PPTG_01749 [Phytophthora nicotianae INRA-310]|uniref:Carrier domain-containing protein n=1 Tax=Phytophthora nicotianae (strain INRA-310) TaxID=761204 RepID=W2R882_PHYN3|nr:hypothetical protein PPTG_01749 [Phytophthora nicotianae INRA-310]ETN21607.1 hypothetical protein PPTG_01749 [Phytophthora nicotianae INRA-310]